MPTADTEDIKPTETDTSFQRKSGDTHAFQIKRKVANWLAFEDAHFIDGSALFLPALAPDADGYDGLLLLGMVLIRARDNPIEKALLTWHSASSADLKLAQTRSAVIMHLLKGESDALAKLALAETTEQKEAGLTHLLDFVANWQGWRCSVAEQSVEAPSADASAAKPPTALQAAVAAFQRAYGASPIGKKLEEDPPAAKTWEALFTLLQHRLAALCVVKFDDLAALRGKLQFASKKEVGCEDKQPPASGKVGATAASARRVEVIFVRGSEEPELKCHAGACAPDKCDLFNAKIHKHDRVLPKWIHLSQVVPYLLPGAGSQEIHYKSYGLAKDKVTLTVKDSADKAIYEVDLKDPEKQDGAHKIVWDGTCNQGAAAGKLLSSADGPFTIKLTTGADFDARPFSGDVVDPKLEVEYLVVPLDRELAKAQPPGEDALKPAAITLELWLAPYKKAPPFDKGAVLTVKGAGQIKVWSDEALTKAVDLALPLPKDKLKGGKKLKLWATGAAAGLCELTVSPEGGAIKTTVKMAVVDLAARLQRWSDANPPALVETTKDEKIKVGQPLHLQSSSSDFTRAKLVLSKIDPKAWPEETDDYELVLAVPKDSGSGGAITVFDADKKGAELTLPLRLKKKDLLAADKVLWLEGKTTAKKARDLALDLGLDRKDGGPAKKPKEGADRLYLTIIEFEKVAPLDQFDAPSADYKADKHRLYVNTAAGGRKLKLKARLKPALAGVRAHFMLVPGDKNGLVEETTVAVPATVKTSTGAAWTWDKIDAALQKKDKKDAADHWHLSGVTDDKGEVTVEVESSSIGSDVFYAAVYSEQDPELAKFVYADLSASPRKPAPLLSKKLTVWRKLWYQLAKAKTCAAPVPGRMVTAYERVKAEVVACTTKLFQKGDLPANLQPVTFYPEWMVKPGGGDDEVAVVGDHNKGHFWANAATFFPDEVGAEDDLKARVLAIDYQWDPEGWTNLKQFTQASKTSGDILMSAKVVKPPLSGALIHVGTWQALKKADGSEVAKGDLTDDNIVIAKPRTDCKKVKVKLPDAADTYLADAATYEVKVTLQLAMAKNYLGESAGRNIMAVYDPSDVSDYNDTVSHELGHSVRQTRPKDLQPKGLPEHPFWNDGGQGVHCSTPTAPTVRKPVAYAGGARAAQSAAECLMFSAGPVPTAGNKFCDVCHHYLLAQDMTSLS